MGAATNHPLVLLVLGLACLIEYVFPPFPGDTITILGAILVGAYGWSLVLVFSVLMLGSVLGSAGAYALGRRWAASGKLLQTSTLATLVARFERRGVWLLLVNRFLPGIRPLFFIAAGLAKMPASLVLIASAMSAALWNALLMVLGASLGNNLDAIGAWMRRYTQLSWALLVTLLLLWLARWIWRRRAGRGRR